MQVLIQTQNHEAMRSVIKFPDPYTGYAELIYVTAENVSVDGFTLDNDSVDQADDPYGIYTEKSNFTVKITL